MFSKHYLSWIINFTRSWQITQESYQDERWSPGAVYWQSSKRKLQRHFSRKTASCWLSICQPLFIIKLPKIDIFKFVCLSYWNLRSITLVSTSSMCPCITKYGEIFVRYDGCLFQNATDGFGYRHIFTYVTKSRTQALPLLTHTKLEALEIVNRKEFGENWLETDCFHSYLPWRT